MRILSCHQPALLPYAGFWVKYALSDAWVWLMDRKVSKEARHNRVTIGDDQKNTMFTLPISNPSSYHEAVLSPTYNARKTSEMLKQVHARCDHREPVVTEFANFFSALKGGDPLAEILLTTCYMLGVALEIDIDHPSPILADMGHTSPSDWLAEQTLAAGCDAYLSGPSGELYLVPEAFRARRVGLLIMNRVKKEGFGSVSAFSLLAAKGDRWREYVEFERGTPWRQVV